MAKINKKCHIEVPDPYHIKTSPLILLYKANILQSKVSIYRDLRHVRVKIYNVTVTKRSTSMNLSVIFSNAMLKSIW